MKKVLTYILYVAVVFLSFLVLQNFRGERIEIFTPPTEEAFLIEPLVFDGPPAVTDDLTTLSTWPLLRNEAGLAIFRENTNWKNYLLIVDPVRNNISVKNLYGSMGQHWDQSTNPICIFNGGFFEPDGSPTFPIIENGHLIPGKMTNQFPVRILYLDNGQLKINGISTNGEVQTSQFAMSGLNPDFYNGDWIVTNRTVIGVKDNLLYAVFTQNRSVEEVILFMTNDLGLDPNSTIALDSGYSSQIRCFGEDYLSSSSVMGSTIIISNP